MERWDAYNSGFIKQNGVVLTRGEPIPPGLYHLVCDVLVQHVDRDYLLMQRDPRKSYGGMWEATAGGSALQGEDPPACARRELLEETGIEAECLTEVGQVLDKSTIYVEYLCRTDCSKNSIILQEGETVAYRWVSRDELLRMSRGELLTERMQSFIAELR